MDFRLLGPLENAGDGQQPYRLPGTRLPALLAMLLLNANRTVGFEQLARGVWGEPPRAASSNLRTYVAQLRRALIAAGGTGSTLTTQAGGYRLTIDRTELDLIRFEGLADAAEQAMRRADPHTALRLFRQALDLKRWTCGAANL